MEMWVQRQLSKNMMQGPTLGPHRPVLWMEQLPQACLRLSAMAGCSLLPGPRISQELTTHTVSPQQPGTCFPSCPDRRGMVGWRLPSHSASTGLLRPHTQKGRKGVTTMPPVCVVSLSFCPKRLIHMASDSLQLENKIQQMWCEC